MAIVGKTMNSGFAKPKRSWANLMKGEENNYATGDWMKIGKAVLDV